MKYKISVIGLGYVGLPLAVEFAKKYPTVGFDINKSRISELKKGIDLTHEIAKKDLLTVLNKSNKSENSSKGLSVTNNVEDILESNFYIITVPTPVDKNNQPDFSPLINATKLIAEIISEGDYIIYESTVYPGATEEICIPILEDISNLILNKDFFVGYSPERINPGDKTHTLTKILKVTSGSNKESSIIIDNLYKSIISAGTHLAPSIKVAEAAKVIENSQRDINIAFVNELAKIFNLLNIDTSDVLKAASTKWNFLNFKPGLVGGHCIGVDPYYLAQKAKSMGYHPEIILSGRRLNDGMGKYIVGEIIKLMINRNIKISNSKVLLLGITFKENCPDTRNSKAIDVYNELKSYNVDLDVYDPVADNENVKKEYGIELINEIQSSYDTIVLVVSHSEFLKIDFKNNLKKNGLIYDIKSYLSKNVDARL